MNERKFNWFVENMPKATKECPYYIDQFFGYWPTPCAEDCEKDRIAAEKRIVDASIKFFTSRDSTERKNAIQVYANESGLSFVDAKMMLEAIEADYGKNDGEKK